MTYAMPPPPSRPAPVGVVQTMHADAGMPPLLARAHGVFIVPTCGRAALGIGGADGSGVPLIRRPDGTWSNLAFFDVGAIGIGLQAGAEGGPIALVLLNDKAVDSFRKRNNFSLGADAGLTVVNFARLAAGSTAGDVVVRSGNEGLFGSAVTVGITDVRFNQRLTEAYDGAPVTAQQALDSTMTDARADALRKALGSAPTAAATGATMPRRRRDTPGSRQAARQPVAQVRRSTPARPRGVRAKKRPACSMRQVEYGPERTRKEIAYSHGSKTRRRYASAHDGAHGQRRWPHSPPIGHSES